jgi:hypothetical protein
MEDNKILEKIKTYFRLTKKNFLIKLINKVFFFKKLKIFNIAR